jgi:transposase-like protein
MQRTVSLDLLVSVSESGFSLDELVVVLKKVADEKGLAGIASMILRLVDQMLQQRNLHDGSLPGEPCCERPAYEALQLQDRRVRSSIGKIEFRWRRYVCKQCGKTRVPLRDFLGLEQHQSKTNELEQVVVEVITDQSYRRSSRHLKNIGGIPVPRTTAHRWVTETESDQVETPEEKLSSLLVDGTGYKRRPDPEAGLLRIELPPEDGEPVASEDYQEIRRKVRQAEEEIDRLVEGLTDRGYRRAAKYVGQARDRLFSYIRFWLRYGVVNPKVTSFIERLMREVGRRLKRIAFG